MALQRQPVIIVSTRDRAHRPVHPRRQGHDAGLRARPAGRLVAARAAAGSTSGYFALQYLIWLGCYLGVNHITAGRSALQPLLPGETAIPLVLAAYPFYGSVYLEIVLPLFLSRTRRAYTRAKIALARWPRCWPSRST